MRIAEAEGADEKSKRKRLSKLFASKNMRTKILRNSCGALIEDGEVSDDQAARLLQKRKNERNKHLYFSIS